MSTPWFSPCGCRSQKQHRRRGCRNGTNGTNGINGTNGVDGQDGQVVVSSFFALQEDDIPTGSPVPFDTPFVPNNPDISLNVGSTYQFIVAETGTYRFTWNILALMAVATPQSVGLAVNGAVPGADSLQTVATPAIQTIPIYNDVLVNLTAGSNVALVVTGPNDLIVGGGATNKRTMTIERVQTGVVAP